MILLSWNEMIDWLIVGDTVYMHWLAAWCVCRECHTWRSEELYIEIWLLEMFLVILFLKILGLVLIKKILVD